MTALSCSLAYRADGAEVHFPPGTLIPTLCIIEGLPATMYTISLPYHRLTRANTPASVSFQRFLSFSPWRAPARLRLKNQKSLENTSLAGAEQFAGAEMCPDKKKPTENTCCIVKGLDAVWAHFCPSKPCLPLSIDGTFVSLQLLRQEKRRDPNVRTAPERACCKVGPTRALGRKAE